MYCKIDTRSLLTVLLLHSVDLEPGNGTRFDVNEVRQVKKVKPKGKEEPTTSREQTTSKG